MNRELTTLDVMKALALAPSQAGIISTLTAGTFRPHRFLKLPDEAKPVYPAEFVLEACKQIMGAVRVVAEADTLSHKVTAAWVETQPGKPTVYWEADGNNYSLRTLE